MKRKWPWIDWVQRRFAKPDETGSIPATASILPEPPDSDTFGPVWTHRRPGFLRGKRVGLWICYRRGDFWAGLVQTVRSDRGTKRGDMGAAYEDCLFMDKHKQLCDALNAHMNIRDKYIAMSRELSALKRQPKGTDDGIQ